ncbi:hypothetical protein [Mycolicibacterium setense]|uniref:hypothetical protein n=1 Tax=Mycolicibacterium setense TaxID=431269 RepID=UPI0006907980|nr:hypothetical protein [Mycolicibacterium setense]MCV7110502.1 hypothetical protein [Mycolicibacterium setense]
MTFPNGPYGQGFTDTPGYPQQPGYPQHPGWPQQPGHFPGYPQPGYPAGYQPNLPKGPSGATGIIAAILALPGALVGLFYVVTSVVIIWSDHEYAVGAVFGLAGAAVGLALFIGAIALFRRKMIGRRLIIGGCAVAILSGLAALCDMAIGITGNPSREPVGFSVAIIVGLVFPTLTLVLAMLPSTARWIQAKPAKPHPVAAQAYQPSPAYPPYPR